MTTGSENDDLPVLVEVEDGAVKLTIQKPDGTKTVALLSPDAAKEFADGLFQATDLIRAGWPLDSGGKS